MRNLLIIVFNSVFFLNMFASEVPGDSTKAVDIMTKAQSLANAYHQEDCPKDIVEQISQLYSEATGISEVKLPFDSFNCLPIKIKDRDLMSIKLHPDIDYEDNVMISMKSKDGGCLVFLDVLLQSMNTLLKSKERKGWNIKNKLLQDIASNQSGQPRWSALKSSEIDIEKAYDKQVRIYTTESPVVQNCNADTIFVCSLPERANVGYYVNNDSGNRVYNTLNGYKTAYKVVLTSQNHFPIYLFLFCKKKGDKALNKYLDNISQSIHF